MSPVNSCHLDMWIAAGQTHAGLAARQRRGYVLSVIDYHTAWRVPCAGHVCEQTCDCRPFISVLYFAQLNVPVAVVRRKVMFWLSHAVLVEVREGRRQQGGAGVGLNTERDVVYRRATSLKALLHGESALIVCLLPPVSCFWFFPNRAFVAPVFCFWYYPTAPGHDMHVILPVRQAEGT